MEKYIEEIKMKLGNYSGGKILDVGTGRGEFIEIIKEVFNNYSEIIAIDSEENAIKLAKDNLKDENIKFIQMDAKKMDFEDNSFDTVCLSNSIHHLPNIESILNEIKRVTKPEGIIIINEMFCDNQNNDQMSHVYLHHFSAKINRLNGICHNDTFKKGEILDIVKNNNIKILDSFQYNYDEPTMDEEYLKKLVGIVDRILEEIKGRAEYEEYKKEGEEIKNWILSNGMAGASELMIVGRK